MLIADLDKTRANFEYYKLQVLHTMIIYIIAVIIIINLQITYFFQKVFIQYEFFSNLNFIKNFNFIIEVTDIQQAIHYIM